MSRLTRYARALMAAASLLMWGGAVFATPATQDGHQSAKPAAKPEAKPAAKPAPHGTAPEKPAPVSHGAETTAADHSKGASSHATESATPAAAGGARPKPSQRNAESSARDVVQRIESIMALEAVKAAPPKAASPAARRPQPAAAGSRRTNAPIVRAKPAPLLKWDAALSPNNVTLVWDAELAPKVGGRTGVLLAWPADQTTPPRK